jgi:hypothetical protein
MALEQKNGVTLDRELPMHKLYIDMIEHKETRFLEAVKCPSNTNYTVDFLFLNTIVTNRDNVLLGSDCVIF